jgi:hypothetical protein
MELDDHIHAPATLLPGEKIPRFTLDSRPVAAKAGLEEVLMLRLWYPKIRRRVVW